MPAYSVEVCKELAAAFRRTGIHRPMVAKRYDEGDQLVYEVEGLTGDSAQNRGRSIMAEVHPACRERAVR